MIGVTLGPDPGPRGSFELELLGSLDSTSDPLPVAVDCAVLVAAPPPPSQLLRGTAPAIALATSLPSSTRPAAAVPADATIAGEVRAVLKAPATEATVLEGKGRPRQGPDADLEEPDADLEEPPLYGVRDLPVTAAAAILLAGLAVRCALRQARVCLDGRGGQRAVGHAQSRAGLLDEEDEGEGEGEEGREGGEGEEGEEGKAEEGEVALVVELDGEIVRLLVDVRGLDTAGSLKRVLLAAAIEVAQLPEPSQLESSWAFYDATGARLEMGTRAALRSVARVELGLRYKPRPRRGGSFRQKAAYAQLAQDNCI